LEFLYSLALGVHELNAAWLLETADCKQVDGRMPLRHECSQPTTSLVVVLDTMRRFQNVLFGGQVGIFKEIELVTHGRGQQSMTRRREEGTVHGPSAAVRSDRLGGSGMCRRSIVSKLAQVPDIDSTIETSRGQRVSIGVQAVEEERDMIIRKCVSRSGRW